MFSGIVEEVGKISSYDLSRMTVQATSVLADLRVSDSISVAGVCLTVIERGEGYFVVDTVPETVHRSNFKDLKSGDGVNLERALALGDRIGGHMVQGHVDGRGVLQSMEKDGNSINVRINCGSDVLKYVVEKGFVTVDGASLTVTEVDDAGFGLAIIPFTLENTTLNERNVGDAVNIEVDVTAKYVEKLVTPHLEGHLANNHDQNAGSANI
jgi:riboflavin synthase